MTTVFVAMDSEQAELVRLGLEAIDGLLAARLTRADPDRIISGSMTLQRRKMLALRETMEREVLGEWDQLEDGLKTEALRLCQHLLQLPDQEGKSQAWRNLTALMARTNVQKKRSPAD